MMINVGGGEGNHIVDEQKLKILLNVMKILKFTPVTGNFPPLERSLFIQNQE